jgi:hypothetical protein
MHVRRKEEHTQKKLFVKKASQAKDVVVDVVKAPFDLDLSGKIIK